MKKILTFFLLINLSISNIQCQTAPKIILVIDPGHGGKDPGVLRVNGSSDEKEINLIISKMFGHYCDSLLDNVDVFYTRTTDTFISLEDRTEFANKKLAHYFISIHVNSNPDSRIYGTELHVHTASCKESYELAEKIQNQLDKRAGRKIRGIKNFKDRDRSNILVVKNTKMPAVLIECGFISNAEEEEFLNSDEGQNLIASAIFRAFREMSKAHFKKEESEKNTTPNKEIKKEVKGPVYKIKIMSSATKVALNHEQFKRLNIKVEERIDKNAPKYKYQYFVGNYKNKADAEAMKQKVQKKGFKDAYLVKFKN